MDSPLLQYPIAIWLFLEGKKAFIEGGPRAVAKGMLAHMDKVGDNLKSWADSLKPATKE